MYEPPALYRFPSINPTPNKILVSFENRPRSRYQTPQRVSSNEGRRNRATRSMTNRDSQKDIKLQVEKSFGREEEKQEI